MVIKRGLSDFHKMCITIMKMHNSNQNPTIMHTVNLEILIMMPLLKILRHFCQNNLMKKKFLLRH